MKIINKQFSKFEFLFVPKFYLMHQKYVFILKKYLKNEDNEVEVHINSQAVRTG